MERTFKTADGEVTIKGNWKVVEPRTLEGFFKAIVDDDFYPEDFSVAEHKERAKGAIDGDYGTTNDHDLKLAAWRLGQAWIKNGESA